MRIEHKKLVNRQMLVAGFTCFILLLYALFVNMNNLIESWNIWIGFLNFSVLIVSLFISKWIVELIYGVKFKDYRWYVKSEEHEK